MELINGIRGNFRENYHLKFKNSQREKFANGQYVFLLPYGQQGGKILNLLVLECQITKSTKRGIDLNTELKRQNSQANLNRSITFFKDSEHQSLAKPGKVNFQNELNNKYKQAFKIGYVYVMFTCFFFRLQIKI